MITYLYWTLIIFLVVAVIGIIGVKMEKLKLGLPIAAILLFIAWTAYYFHFQQVFVKRWGGIMSITVPEGQYHMGATWKDDNLWIENYDPTTNSCYFNEYSKGNMLQGKVIIKKCNPLMPVAPEMQ